MGIRYCVQNGCDAFSVSLGMACIKKTDAPLSAVNLSESQQKGQTLYVSSPWSLHEGMDYVELGVDGDYQHVKNDVDLELAKRWCQENGRTCFSVSQGIGICQRTEAFLDDCDLTPSGDDNQFYLYKDPLDTYKLCYCWTEHEGMDYVEPTEDAHDFGDLHCAHAMEVNSEADIRRAKRYCHDNACDGFVVDHNMAKILKLPERLRLGDLRPCQEKKRVYLYTPPELKDRAKEWSLHPGRKLSDQVPTLKIDEGEEPGDAETESQLDRVKRYCERNGFFGFYVVGYQAYVKKTAQQITKDQLIATQDCTAGHPHRVERLRAELLQRDRALEALRTESQEAGKHIQDSVVRLREGIADQAVEPPRSPRDFKKERQRIMGSSVRSIRHARSIDDIGVNVGQRSIRGSTKVPGIASRRSWKSTISRQMSRGSRMSLVKKGSVVSASDDESGPEVHSD